MNALSFDGRGGARLQAVAGAAALALGLVLLRQADAAVAIDGIVSGAWCGPARADALTLLGHCARCWPALSVALLGAGVLFNALLACTKAPARA